MKQLEKLFVTCDESMVFLIQQRNVSPVLDLIAETEIVRDYEFWFSHSINEKRPREIHAAFSDKCEEGASYDFLAVGFSGDSDHLN